MLSTICRKRLLSGAVFHQSLFTSFQFSSSKSQSLEDLKETWLQRFEENGIPDGEASVRFITEHVLGRDKAMDCSLQAPKYCLTVKDIRRINELCLQRLKRVPVQYILGDWEFRYLTLIMRPPVFIPRPETEGLVDLVAKYHNLAAAETFSFLEVGCGSGAICLSLLSEFPRASCIAIDKSKEAVNLTKDNAQRCCVSKQMSVHHADVGSLTSVVGGMKFDAVISNPPYIPEPDMAQLQPEVSRHEDTGALCGGPDGLDVIKEMLHVSTGVLKPRGSVWLEVDLSHPRQLQPWINKSNLRLEYSTTFNDFTGR